MLDCFIASYFSQIRKTIWSPKHFFYFYIIFYVFSDFGPKYGDCTNLLAVRVTRWDRREPCRMSGQVHWGPLHTQNCAVLKKISSCNMAPLRGGWSQGEGGCFGWDGIGLVFCWVIQGTWKLLTYFSFLRHSYRLAGKIGTKSSTLHPFARSFVKLFRIFISLKGTKDHFPAYANCELRSVFSLFAYLHHRLAFSH